MTTQMTQFAIEAALLAGEFLRASFNTPHKIESKEGKQNLVTECDIGAEERILSFLHKKFPSHGFLSEEKGEGNLAADIIWVIDPLDGTVNFARNIPQFSVSIAACQGSEPIVGVVFDPIREELFVAEKNKGAFLNKAKIEVSKVDSLDHALLSSGFPYNIDENPLNCIEIFSSFLRKGSPIRRLGSAALDLSYLAAGRFDAYWETGIKPWDIAAGILLIQEAGGCISKWDGSKESLFHPVDLLASNSHLHKLMVQALREGVSSCN